jgi:hypothetical protein
MTRGPEQIPNLVAALAAGVVTVTFAKERRMR